MIQFKCHSCGQKIKVEDKKAGTTGKCPKCRTSFLVPSSPPQEPAAAAISFVPKVIAVVMVLAITGNVDAEVTYLGTWGGAGSDDGQFDTSYGGIAVGPDGDVYVADENNHRIQKFDRDGTFITKWGVEGSGDGEFSRPAGIDVSPTNDVYVGDRGNSRIQKFNASGGFVTSWGGFSPGGSAFDVAVGPSGNVYVADPGNFMIKKFTGGGALITSWGSEGSGDGKFMWGIGVDPSERVFAVDSAGTYYRNLLWFDSDGTFIDEREGLVSSPAGLDIGLNSEVYVVNFGNRTVQKFTSDGDTLSVFTVNTGGPPLDIAVSATGDVYVLEYSWVHRYFDSDAWVSGANVFDDAGVGPGQLLGTFSVITAAMSLTVANAIDVEPGGTLSLAGGDLTASNLNLHNTAVFNAEGLVDSPVFAYVSSEINATGNVTIGSSTDPAGVRIYGQVNIGSHEVTLLDSTFAQVGSVNINGGTVVAANGLVLLAGNDLIGNGSVNGRVSVQEGSTIQATTGSLSIGDSNHPAGFFSNGELSVGDSSVTLKDQNFAVLGSHTSIEGGTLTATNDILLEQGKNLTGHGEVNGDFKNHGDVIGDGTDLAKRLVFNDPFVVSGNGTFTNTLILGTFAPGDSPAITTGPDQGFGGIIEIELGGTTPGFGDDNHDQIIDFATILLANNPTLSILSFNNFVPMFNDEFVVMKWQPGLSGDM